MDTHFVHWKYPLSHWMYTLCALYPLNTNGHFKFYNGHPIDIHCVVCTVDTMITSSIPKEHMIKNTLFEGIGCLRLNFGKYFWKVLIKNSQGGVCFDQNSKSCNISCTTKPLIIQKKSSINISSGAWMVTISTQGVWPISDKFMSTYQVQTSWQYIDLYPFYNNWRYCLYLYFKCSMKLLQYISFCLGRVNEKLHNIWNIFCW